MLINKRNHKFGVDRVNLSKLLFILLFLTLCKLAKICNSGFHGARGFFVEDYQEDVYEKLVNGTYGFVGKAF